MLTINKRDSETGVNDNITTVEIRDQTEVPSRGVFINAPEENPPKPDSPEKKTKWFSKENFIFKKKATKNKNTQLATASKPEKLSKRKTFDKPIRLLVGYLPEVSASDALSYAEGIADKHCEQIDIAYFDAYPYGTGFAYEVQEGGSGKGYLPAILAYFKDQGQFEQGEASGVFVNTTSRTIKISRTREGISALILPESAIEKTTDWLEPGLKLRPAIKKRTNYLIAGATLFATGLLVLAGAYATRIQPYETPLPPISEKIDYAMLPLGQIEKLSRHKDTEYVKALKYNNGKWTMDIALIPDAASDAASPTNVKK